MLKLDMINVLGTGGPLLALFFETLENNHVSRKPCKRRSDLVNRAVRELCRRRTACISFSFRDFKVNNNIFPALLLT